MATPMESGLDQTATDPVEDKSIQALALLGGGEAGKSNRAGGAGGKVAGLSAPEARCPGRRQSKSPRPIPLAQPGSQKQEQGRSQLDTPNPRRPAPGGAKNPSADR